MNTSLLDFHKKLRPELIELLGSFNLLLYGYGCKRKLLEEIFPEAVVFNGLYLKLEDIIQEILLLGHYEDKHPTIEKIDQFYDSKDKLLVIIITNFDFKFQFLRDLKSIRIVGTVENIDFTFDNEDIEDFNFIYRDFTTFEPYTDEIIDVDLFDNKAKNTIMVINSVSKRAKFVFKRLLELKSPTISDLFKAIKHELMITRVNIIIEQLNEFIDHKIIKLTEKSQIKINLNKEEIECVLKEANFEK